MDLGVICYIAIWTMPSRPKQAQNQLNNCYQHVKEEAVGGAMEGVETQVTDNEMMQPGCFLLIIILSFNTNALCWKHVSAVVSTQKD